MILLLFNVMSFTTDFYRWRLFFLDKMQKPFNFRGLFLDRVYILFINEAKFNSNHEILLKVTHAENVFYIFINILLFF